MGTVTAGFVASWLADGAFNYGHDGERVQAGAVDAAQATAPRADFSRADFIDGLEGSSASTAMPVPVQPPAPFRFLTPLANPPQKSPSSSLRNKTPPKGGSPFVLITKDYTIEIAV